MLFFSLSSVDVSNLVEDRGLCFNIFVCPIGLLLFFFRSVLSFGLVCLFAVLTVWYRNGVTRNGNGEPEVSICLYKICGTSLLIRMYYEIKAVQPKLAPSTSSIHRFQYHWCHKWKIKSKNEKETRSVKMRLCMHKSWEMAVTGTFQCPSVREREVFFFRSFQFDLWSYYSICFVSHTRQCYCVVIENVKNSISNRHLCFYALNTIDISCLVFCMSIVKKKEK